MGLQLIFVVETNKECKSDWIYIKETIDRFFSFDSTQIKLSPVYLDGKWKYRKKEKEIRSLVSQYKAGSKHNESIVLFCVDCDEYDCKQDDMNFLKDVQAYCNEKGYKFVWFCRDIEHVYLKERIEAHQKKSKSVSFMTQKKIRLINVNDLMADTFRDGKSNLINVLSNHLSRKKD